MTVEELQAKIEKAMRLALEQHEWDPMSRAIDGYLQCKDDLKTLKRMALYYESRY